MSTIASQITGNSNICFAAGSNLTTRKALLCFVWCSVDRYTVKTVNHLVWPTPYIMNESSNVNGFTQFREKNKFTLRSRHMSAIASQITGNSNICSAAGSIQQREKHRISTLLCILWCSVDRHTEKNIKSFCETNPLYDEWISVSSVNNFTQLGEKSKFR